MRKKTALLLLTILGSNKQQYLLLHGFQGSSQQMRNKLLFCFSADAHRQQKKLTEAYFQRKTKSVEF